MPTVPLSRTIRLDGVLPMLDYVECDVPDGMTLRQWRRSHTAATPHPHRLRRRLRRPLFR
jgi:hypothetical protein